MENFIFLCSIKSLQTYGHRGNNKMSTIKSNDPANIFLFKVNNRNTRKKVRNMFKINNKNTRMTSMTSF